MPTIKPLVDEGNLQRRELERLLTTAKDERRKSFIENAIASLDLTASTTATGGSSNEPISMKSPASLSVLHPGLKSVLRNGSDAVPFESFMATGNESTQQISAFPTSSSSSPPSKFPLQRPMSANVRRPSMTSLLHAIPENRIILHGTVEENVEVDIAIDDIADVSSSSHDPRFPPINIFKSPKLRTGRGWMPTGLMPQVLYITFNIGWFIKSIEVTCTGVEEISVAITSARVMSTSGSIKLQRVKENYFLYESEQGTQGTPGSKLCVMFNKATQDFFCVSEMKIRCLQVA